MQNNEKYHSLAFVTDFDGTISDEDFFHYVSEAFFDDSALEPWNRYRAGEISHFDALRLMYSTLRVCEKELAALIKNVHIDQWVVPTFKMLHDAGVPIYIASAGCDYYINILFGQEIKEYNAILVTNPSHYYKAQGLVMERPPKNCQYYDEAVGISKKKVVQLLQQEGRHVVFAGDGPPDIEPSRIADTVFAKKILLEKCIEEGIRTENFEGFKNIYNFFEGKLKP